MSGESIKADEVWQIWLEPFDAVKRLIGAGLDNRSQAVDWIKARLSEGNLRAVAWTVNVDEDFNVTSNYIAACGVRIRRSIKWIDWQHDFWVSGCFEPEIDDDGDSVASWQPSPRTCFYALDRVRFDPELIEAFCRKNGSENPKPIPSLSLVGAGKGGRPPKPFWDRLWVSVAAKLHNGDLQPNRQADIERAMHEWFAQNGEDAGETAVRAKARLLWEEINREVEN